MYVMSNFYAICRPACLVTFVPVLLLSAQLLHYCVQLDRVMCFIVMAVSDLPCHDS